MDTGFFHVLNAYLIGYHRANLRLSILVIRIDTNDSFRRRSIASLIDKFGIAVLIRDGLQLGNPLRLIEIFNLEFAWIDE